MPDDASDPRKQVGLAVARVKAGRDDELAVGLAIALDRRRLVTCAHVVNQALGRKPDDERSRPDPQHRYLWLDFLFVRCDRRARVVIWVPRSDGKPFEARDVAVLEVEEDLAAAVQFPRLVQAGGRPAVEMFSAPDHLSPPSYVVGELGGPIGEELQVHVKRDSAVPVQPGFSGGPIWRPDTGEVIGMVHGRSPSKGRIVYGVPADVIARAWPALHPLPWESVPGPQPSPGPEPPRPRPRPAPIPEPKPGVGDGLRRAMRNPWLLLVPLMACVATTWLGDGRAGGGERLSLGLGFGVLVYGLGVLVSVAPDLVALAVRRREAVPPAGEPDDLEEASGSAA
jgi:hypothetical protein